jgi:hypothetical protein
MLQRTLNNTYTDAQVQRLASYYAGNVLDNADADNTQDVLQQQGYSADLYTGTGTMHLLYAYCVLLQACKDLQAGASVVLPADVQQVLDAGKADAGAGLDAADLDNALQQAYVLFVRAAGTTPYADTDADLQDVLAGADL